MGKFDSEIHTLLFDSKNIKLDESTKFTTFFESFYIIKDIFLNELCVEKSVFLEEIKRKLEGLELEHRIQENQEKREMIHEILLISIEHMLYASKCILKDIIVNEQNIDKKCWELYLHKNMQYGDAWYMNGLFGIFYDLHRKAVRVYNIIDDCQKSELIWRKHERMEDTLCDIILYCTMMSVALKQEDIFLFGTKELKMNRELMKNVEF